ncbi:MAG: 3-hydroxyacyl-CoA dehydrogenase NAD-binding domain-containing protein [Ignavibacteria bacterium]|nr:3-hydroxyacyl-CoA dehydrogenase NAD-binding domain-containing protein [Ignavibacteria bacterium]
MIKSVGIVGAGTMGNGIAQVAARAGFDVVLYDISTEVLKDAMARIKEDFRRGVEKGKITATEATEAFSAIHPRRNFGDMGNADFIIEAVAEDLNVKKEIFKKLDAIVAPEAILTSNTSSLSISAIASLTKTPESVVGMHFFNPPALMKLVEVVRGRQTSDETTKTACDLALRMKKIPVVCKDTPGFIVNRVARPFYGEALRLLAEGVATVEEIDMIVKMEGGFKMGPFELMDLIGIDVNYAVTKSVYEQFFHEPRFRPHPIQRQMVEAGTLGRKTKKGFYTYK